VAGNGSKKNKGVFQKRENRRIAGGQKSLVVVTVCQFQNYWMYFILKTPNLCCFSFVIIYKV
jgi:hypothetical protein